MSYAGLARKEGLRLIRGLMLGARGPGAPDEEHVFCVEAEFGTTGWTRKDLDNLCKLVIDAANGVVWRDDIQVHELRAKMHRGVAPFTRLRISACGTYDAPKRACRLCGALFRLYPSTEGARFCSRACADESLRTGERGACPVCSAEMYRAPWQRGRVTCSRACDTVLRTREVACAECGVPVRRPRSLVARAAHGLEFCSTEHRIAHQRKDAGRLKTKHGRGICGTCGGATSHKRYDTCRPCKLARDGRLGVAPAVEQPFNG